MNPNKLELFYKMKISVIIITRNRKEDFRKSLDAFINQTYQDKEIIVIDNASDDGTREMMLSEYSDIKYLWLPENFDIRSINIGVSMCSGDIIWRTDDDSNPEHENVFSRVVEILENHPEIDIIATQDIEVRRGNEPWDWYPYPIDKVNVPEDGYKSNYFQGTGAAIRKKVFDKIGGFWEFGYEEFDFCSRAIIAGFNVRFFPNLKVLHYASKSGRQDPNRWLQYCKQIMRYNVKFFPNKLAFGRALQVMIYQSIDAIVNKVGILIYFEAVFSMIAVAFKTARSERIICPEDKLYDITLGINYFKAQMKYFKLLLKLYLNKRLNKS